MCETGQNRRNKWEENFKAWVEIQSDIFKLETPTVLRKLT